jgi:hypothetical protein
VTFLLPVETAQFLSFFLLLTLMVRPATALAAAVLVGLALGDLLAVVFLCTLLTYGAESGNLAMVFSLGPS